MRVHQVRLHTRRAWAEPAIAHECQLGPLEGVEFVVKAEHGADCKMQRAAREDVDFEPLEGKLAPLRSRD